MDMKDIEELIGHDVEVELIDGRDCGRLDTTSDADGVGIWLRPLHARPNKRQLHPISKVVTIGLGEDGK